MTEKRFNLRAGYYDEYTGICGGNNENFTTNEVVDLLNEQDENLNLLIEGTRCINKQRHNLVNYLKRIGHSLEDIKKIMNDDFELSEKYYEVWFYQENGFASTNYRIKSFKNKEKANEYAKIMNKEDKDAFYKVYEKEFDD